MGIIEFHLHEPDFDFSPSMSTGRSDKEDTDMMGDRDDLDTEWSPDDEESSGGMGKFVALAVLIGLGALLGMRRRRSGSTDHADELETEDEVEVYN